MSKKVKEIKTVKNPYIKIDKELEKKGIWADYGTYKILLARSGGSNEKFNKLWLKYTKEYPKGVGHLKEHRQNEILADIFAKGVILEWHALDPRDEDGKLYLENKLLMIDYEANTGEYVEATHENIVKALVNEPELLKDVMGLSMDETQYAKEQEEIVIKNLSSL